MNIRILYGLFFLFYYNLNAQNFDLNIINLSENPTIEDFSFLKEELKDVQVVMLGEKTHFDGNVFEMKTKIVKYLFQEMGFNTIAFESGVYDVWRAQTHIENGGDTTEAFRNSLFTIWAKRKEFQSFIEFYDMNKADLKLYGFDSQISGRYGEKELIKDLFTYCSQYKFQFEINQEDLELLIESFVFSGTFDEADISYQQYKKLLKHLLDDISKQKNTEIHFYWTQIIKSLISLGEDYYLNKESVLSSFYVSSNDNIRDKQMADNLLAYIKKHPNEKIICWGANGHFVNNMSSIDTPILKEFLPMGTYIKKALKNKAYSLASITAEDSIYLGNKWNKTPLNNASFEYYLKEKKKPHLFISSQHIEMNKKQLNRLFSPVTHVLGSLDLLHDGYLFFESVTQATPIDSENSEEKTNNSSINETTTLPIEEHKESNIENMALLNHTDSIVGVSVLDEVVLYGKRETHQIIKKAVSNIKINYPDSPSNSKMYSNVKMRVKESACLNLDFITDQYDPAYTNFNRSVKQLKEIRWNIKDGYEPKSLREFHSLIYNNPIKNLPFLTQRKFKKFDYQLDEIKMFNNKKVYVINFSTLREHFTYTRRTFLSNYSGTLYIDQEDYAIVKVIENWKVINFPEELKYTLELNGSLAKYEKREYTNENIETNFVKVDSLYLISDSLIKISGELTDTDNNSEEFETIITSYWSDFNIHNPKLVRFNEEQNLFKNIEYNKTFWETYKFPK